MQKNIVVIGAGTMGNGIAHTFAQNNFKVELVDVNIKSLDKAIQTISNNLDRMIIKEKISDLERRNTLKNITKKTTITNTSKNAILVIEAATENLELKLQIFKDLDKHYDQSTILSSNTSSISITQIASSTKRPNKVIGMHFMNPVPLMKLVEVIKGYETDLETLEFINNITKKINKTAVEVNDYPGFISNRILLPMINEAIESLHHGVSSVKNIDEIMKLGMGHPMGPLQLADFIGLDVCLSILDVMYEGFKSPKYAASPLLKNMVLAGKLGIKSKEGFYDYSNNKKAEVVSKQFQ
ncbi:3-hydroxyacyl-CoA dehydrogenase NAD-binding domain-containing protein [Flavobacteriaceae bacterium]|nr:3-hydroxyacyl-CoA dehydrogenase NAD-binding domain-containing protein [Flavobacteriaceae bacterium]MDC0654467.1 3-hydroxyacyl-CoA dehydrogenase NAD-binding domain-containing protein [Flavobacteriaceae bacterium]